MIVKQVPLPFGMGWRWSEDNYYG